VTLSDISIKNPVFAWMLMVALMLFGAISFSRMGLSQMPDVDFPTVNISVSLEGASPEIMESDVADILEDAVMSVQGIKEVRSTCRHGRANITVELEIERDVDIALQEIQTKVSQAQRSLPRDVDPPVISKQNPEDQPILWLAVTYPEGKVRETMDLIKNRLKDDFQTVPGVGEVFLGGYVDRSLRVWVDGRRLAEQELTVDDVLNTLSREHIEVPAGRLETPSKEYNIRFMGEAPAVEAFGNIPIASRGGSPLYRVMRLKEVADLEDGLDDVRRIARTDGKPAAGMGIRKQRGSNAVEVARRVKERVVALNRDLPSGYRIGINFDSTKFIEDSIHELMFTILLSALLTAFVCWVFLGSWTSTINILLAIPTSILGTFIALYFAGFTLNTFTLLALSLAIGVVVDDAIMVLENIVRHREKGEDRMEGARRGARQITFAATATTLSIVAIFLPVVFMEGIIGKFFFQFGVAISVAVLLSLLEAITLTPMRCSRFLEVGEHETGFTRWVNARYRGLAALYARILPWCLEHRWKVVGISVLFFVASLFLIGPIRKEMVPAQDMSVLTVRFQTPMGSSLESTDSVLRKVEDYLLTRPEVSRFFMNIGGFGGGEVNTAMMFVTLKEPKDRPLSKEPLFKGKPGGPPMGGAGAAQRKPDAAGDTLTAGAKRPADPAGGKAAAASQPAGKIVPRRLTQQEFAQVLRRDLPKLSTGLKVVVQDPSMGGFTSGRGYPVEFTVRGPDWDVLAASALEIEKRMEASSLLVDVDTNYLLGQPELQVMPDREAAALRGVSMASIGNVISVLMGGSRSGKYTEGGHRYDVRVRLKRDQRLTKEDISRLYVRNNRGERVRLSEVVRLVERSSLQSITRIDRERAISVYGSPAPGVDQQQALEESLRIAREVLPEGYHAVLSGSAQGMKESIQSLLFALLLGIVVAYMILGSQFNSFVHPFTILLALPFAVSGALIALLVSGQSINVYSFIGIILLMGLVKKNSILLVDFTNQVRAHGFGARDALLKACPVRLRPIVMTSLSTIAAALPPALAIGPGAETRIPMAIAVIGGMIVSTLLTLLVVPCAYSLMSGLERSKPQSFEPEEWEETGTTEPSVVSNHSTSRS
jgi:HAE1 family hydrophobic/amphiphilic exporter-1